MQSADTIGGFVDWRLEGGCGGEGDLHCGVETCWLEEGDFVILFFGLGWWERVVTGWEGEESRFGSVVFADNGEEAGEVDFGWVVGCFVAEDADFDLFGAGRGIDD